MLHQYILDKPDNKTVSYVLYLNMFAELKQNYQYTQGQLFLSLNNLLSMSCQCNG